MARSRHWRWAGVLPCRLAGRLAGCRRAGRAARAIRLLRLRQEYPVRLPRPVLRLVRVDGSYLFLKIVVDGSFSNFHVTSKICLNRASRYYIKTSVHPYFNIIKRSITLKCPTCLRSNAPKYLKKCVSRINTYIKMQMYIIINFNYFIALR